MLRARTELQDKFLSALRLQENEFAEIARRRSFNDLRNQNRVPERGPKPGGKFLSAAEAEQIRKDEEYARKISMDLAGIEYNQPVDSVSDPHADTDSPFPVPILSDPTPSDLWTFPHNEDPSLATTPPPQENNREDGGLSPQNIAPNNWSASDAQESPAGEAVLLPNRPNAPAFGASSDYPGRLPSEPGSADDPRQAMRRPSPRESLAICEQCQFEQPFVSYCPACSFHFCRDHWDGQPLHHGQRLVNGVPHEKTDPLVAKKVKSIIEPSISEEEQAQLHRADDDTTWFGVLPDAADTSQRLLHDFGRYEEFLSQSMFSPKSGQFPSLISFVGPTGAGKSTIVKGLVKLTESSNGDFRQQTPVVGLVQHHSVPTSGEVHLYWEPSSLKSARPLLYADCEGLGGGSREPMAARATKEKKALTGERKYSNQSKHMSPRNSAFPQSMSAYSSMSPRNTAFGQSMSAYSSMSPRNTPMPPTPGQSSFAYLERASTPSYSPYSPVEENEGQDGWTPGSGKVYRGVTRQITWAQDRDRRSRQFIVEHLYPRLLYTFSDIVVLVMRNPKSVLTDESTRIFR